jgi:glycosyltransferase involved in cell wall biosynthesis
LNMNASTHNLSSAANPAAEPVITIGLPCYNSEKYLAQSIDSLLKQTFRNFVLIISDNASTDGTAEICRRYAAADARVRYVRNPVNIGMSGNFNSVFALARSKYFKWATADDYWDPELLADALAVLEADADIVLCYPRAILVDSEGVEQSRYEDNLHLMQDDPVGRFVAVLEHLHLVNHHLGVMRTDAIRRTHMFGKHLAADIGFVAELSLYGKFYKLPKYQLFRRFHPDSSSWQRGSDEHQARRFHATNARRPLFNTFRFHWAFCRGVLASPVPLAGKAWLLYRLAKGFYWDIKWLAVEVRHDVPMWLRKKKPMPVK